MGINTTKAATARLVPFVKQQKNQKMAFFHYSPHLQDEH